MVRGHRVHDHAGHGRMVLGGPVAELVAHQAWAGQQHLSGVGQCLGDIGKKRREVVGLALVFVVAAFIAIFLGFSPKFGALIQLIPGPVLGGMSIVVFGLIAIAGARIWVVNQVDFSDNRNLIVAAVTLVLGAGNFSIELGAFRLDGIGTATFGAIILYALLRRSKGSAV